MKPKITIESAVGKKAVGRRVKALRKNYQSPTDKKLTIQDICDFTGMSKSSYFSVERGTKALSFEEAYLICCLFSLTFEQLLND